MLEEALLSFDQEFLGYLQAIIRMSSFQFGIDRLEMSIQDYRNRDDFGQSSADCSILRLYETFYGSWVIPRAIEWVRESDPGQNFRC